MKKQRLDRVELLKQAEQFFFEAMLRGWVFMGRRTGANEITVDKEGFSNFTYMNVHHPFKLHDRWIVGEGGRSVGTTMIWDLESSAPIWFMSCGGQYEKKAIPLVKMALRRSYGLRNFYGGRGSQQAKFRGMLYLNTPKDNRFDDFSGFERVWVDSTGQSLGFHRYHGMSLI